MLRTALRPRMLGLLAFALVLAALFAELGSWQLGRARSGQEAPPERAAVPVTEVVAPQQPLDGEAVAGPVTADGVFAGGEQQLVVGRAPDGSDGDGAWVLAPLQVTLTGDDEGAGGTALLPVVRGWVATRDGAGGVEPVAPVPPPPTGPVSLQGELDVSEDPRGTTGTAPGQLASSSSADLLNVWDGGPVYAAHLVQTDPAPAAGLSGVPVPERETGLALQNVSYAFQWWVFAAFAGLMWVKIVRDVHRREVEDAEDAAAEAAERATSTGPPPVRTPEQVAAGPRHAPSPSAEPSREEVP